MSVEQRTDPASSQAEPEAPVVRARGAISERTPARRFALLIFLLSPLAVLALLCVLIALSLQSEPAMVAPPVGAGAGETGMRNDYLTKERQRERAEVQAPEAAEPEGSPPDSAAAPGG